MIIVVKPCPLCGGDLVIRTNRTTGAEFLSCTRWDGTPEGCSHSEKVPESYRLRQLGYPELPLFGEGR